MSTEFERKYARAIEELERTSISKTNRLPLLHRLMMKMGYEERPPQYQSFLRNTVQNGVFFGAAFGLFTAIFLWSNTDWTVLELLVRVIAAGSFFGTWMGIMYKITARTIELTDWEEL